MNPNDLKSIVARHFDYTQSGQFFAGDRFTAKHDCSLEDLLNELSIEHEKDVHDLKDKLEDAEYGVIQGEIDDLKEEVDDLEKDKSNLEAEVAQLKERIAELEKKGNEA